MGHSKYHIAPVGEYFGKWFVLDYSHYGNGHYWLVMCGCGSIQSRRAGQLVNGRTNACRTCSAKDREGNRSPYWKGLGDISYQYLNKLHYRNKQVTVTMQDLLDQWDKQGGQCVYSGLKLSLVFKDTNWRQSTASIDRIDSSKGYISDNIQWVHKRINTMKNDLSDHDFRWWCHIINRHGGVYGL